MPKIGNRPRDLDLAYYTRTLGQAQHLHDAAALYPYIPLLMSGIFDLHSGVELGT